MESEPPLQARLYGEKLGDYQTVSGWWEARHGKPLVETLLPPLGIVIEDGAGPCAALWCYQSVGIGVCFLEFGVTRYGLTMEQTKEAMRFATEACIQVAKAHGDYSYFRVITTPEIARGIERRLGFVAAGDCFTQLYLRRDS